MALRIQWLVNHAKRQCTFKFGGNEYEDRQAPRGWEQIDLEQALGRTIDSWSLLNNREQLLKLCPNGYEAIFPKIAAVKSGRPPTPSERLRPNQMEDTSPSLMEKYGKTIGAVVFFFVAWLLYRGL